MQNITLKMLEKFKFGQRLYYIGTEDWAVFCGFMPKTKSVYIREKNTLFSRSVPMQSIIDFYQIK